jgi:hypothetical protein
VGAALAQIQLVHDQSRQRSRLTDSTPHSLNVVVALFEGRSNAQGPGS